MRCEVCVRGCEIERGATGFCGMRRNEGGALTCVSRGALSRASAVPIESLPLYHFLPGVLLYAVGTYGCSFDCPGCRDHAFARPASASDSLERKQAADVAAAARCAGAAGVAFAFGEPAVSFEFVHDVAKAVRADGLVTVLVTNGSASIDALDAVAPLLDAVVVDVKAFTKEAYAKVSRFGHPDLLRKAIVRIKKQWNIHVECVTNLVPDVNDSYEEVSAVAAWIARSLGSETPWHLTSFEPARELSGLKATRPATIEDARDIGISSGLDFVYAAGTGNDGGRNTICPSCGRVLVRRSGGCVGGVRVERGACSFCRMAMPGRFSAAAGD